MCLSHRLRICDGPPCCGCEGVSTPRRGQSDEPFALRDVQFNDPQVSVLLGAPCDILVKFLLVFRILDAGTMPFPASVHLWHPLVNPRVCATFAHNDQKCPGFPFALLKDRCEAPFNLDAANQ